MQDERGAPLDVARDGQGLVNVLDKDEDALTLGNKGLITAFGQAPDGCAGGAGVDRAGVRAR